MSPSFVSTQYLANSLVLPVQQAQAQLTTAMTELSTGQYANLGLQLGDQSGYELSLKEQVQQLQTLTSGNSVVATNLSTAQDALTSMNTSAQTAVQDLATWTTGVNSGAQLQSIGQTALQELTASANATSGDAYVFGGINSGDGAAQRLFRDRFDGEHRRSNCLYDLLIDFTDRYHCREHHLLAKCRTFSLDHLRRYSPGPARARAGPRTGQTPRTTTRPKSRRA